MKLRNNFSKSRKPSQKLLHWSAPILVKEFFLYTFASDFSYATILTKKKDDGNEVPISYMSSNI